jgi:hypothetical protein
MVEAIRSSETSVLTRASRCHIPEDGTLHDLRPNNRPAPGSGPQGLMMAACAQFTVPDGLHDILPCSVSFHVRHSDIFPRRLSDTVRCVCTDSSAGPDVREGGPPLGGHCARTVLLLLVRIRTYAEGKKLKRFRWAWTNKKQTNKLTNKQTNSVAFSPQVNYTDWVTAANFCG